jgi:hypothetical protein
VLTIRTLWLLIVLSCLFATNTAAQIKNHDQWFVSYYAGRYSDTAFNEIVRFNTEFESSDVHVVSVGKELGIYNNIIQYELEGQFSKHTGDQDHEEINGVFTLRWLPFWWDKYLDTSFAFGNGISYATEDPPLEIRDSDDDETSKWLYYFLVEMAFGVPRLSNWDLFLRIHHRSSVFGAINNVMAGSNFVGLGLRYRF